MNRLSQKGFDLIKLPFLMGVKKFVVLSFGFFLKMEGSHGTLSQSFNNNLKQTGPRIQPIENIKVGKLAPIKLDGIEMKTPNQSRSPSSPPLGSLLRTIPDKTPVKYYGSHSSHRTPGVLSPIMKPESLISIGRPVDTNKKRLQSPTKTKKTREEKNFLSSPEIDLSSIQYPEVRPIINSPQEFYYSGQRNFPDQGIPIHSSNFANFQPQPIQFNQPQPQSQFQPIQPQPQQFQPIQPQQSQFQAQPQPIQSQQFQQVQPQQFQPQQVQPQQTQPIQSQQVQPIQSQQTQQVQQPQTQQPIQSQLQPQHQTQPQLQNLAPGNNMPEAPHLPQQTYPIHGPTEANTKFANLTPEQVEELKVQEEKIRANYRAKFDILRESYPTMNIPEPTINQSIAQIEAAYKQYVRRIIIDSSVEQNKNYLLIIWMIFQYCGRNLFNLPMDGYAQSQFKYLDKYQLLLIELGESSTVEGGTGSNWPVEVRILTMAVINGVIFVLVKMLADKMGAGAAAENFSNMVSSFLTQNKGNDALRRAEQATADFVPPAAGPAAAPMGGMGGMLAGLMNAFGGGGGGDGGGLANIFSAFAGNMTGQKDQSNQNNQQETEQKPKRRPRPTPFVNRRKAKNEE